MIRLAGGPVSWGVDFADAPGNPPYDEVLAGIAASGLRWLELGPVGSLPPRALAAHGLRAVGTFVFDAFHAASGDDARAEREVARVLAAVDAALAAIAEGGGRPAAP